MGPSTRELAELSQRFWNTVAALFARVQLFCIVAFGWAREKPTRLQRELRQWGQSAPPQSGCVQSPQRWLVGHLCSLATYLRGGIVVHQTRRMATGHYIGYFNIRVFKAQWTRSPTDAAGHRFTAVLLWLVQTIADVCVFPILGPGLHRAVRRIQLPEGVVTHRNAVRSYRRFDVSSKSPRGILAARQFGGNLGS